MRLVADENIDPGWVEWLRARGHDVLAVRERARGICDVEVLAIAAEESRILLTDDKDFGDLVFRLRHPCAGVVLLRLSCASRQEALDAFAAAWPDIERHAPGRFLVLTNRMLRIRSME